MSMKPWRRYEYRRKLLTIDELAALSGIRAPILRKRLASGWSIERTMQTPVRAYPKGSKAGRPRS